MTREKRYITTPIYYVNDKPHIGHVYTTTLCDVYARWMRFAGREVFFLTGTDEHAAKVVDAAAERGLSPQDWADQNAKVFQEVFGLLKLTNDDFIRTSEARHTERVTRYVAELLDSGDVYLGEYEGWYDAGQEEYIPENRAKELDFTSPFNGKPLVRKKEENFFFRLSKYAEPLLDLLERGESFRVEPVSRRNEIINRIKDGLNDVPISRTGSTDWGIMVPGNEEHTIYVWIDALFNYLSTVDDEGRRHFWPADVHVTAKDILWFHAVIWPAMLLALQNRPGYEWAKLPKLLYFHSFWIAEGRKMSKSLGNFIDLDTINRYLDTYGLDALRYYLVTQGPLGATDADFASDHFHNVYHTDLVNTVGNCASRVSAMINKYFDGVIPELSTADRSRVIADHNWPEWTAQAVQAAGDSTEAFELDDAIAQGIALIRKVDGFINTTEPFKIAKDESKRDELAVILYQCAETVRIASLLLGPVLPIKMAELWDAYGQTIDPAKGDLTDLAAWGGLQPGTPIRKVALFPRVENPVEIITSDDQSAPNQPQEQP
ncbi:MAG: methionine--tRNA ligase [Phycisphaerales bacterium]|nr:MAG: methionine--tRNA ligase [Phycisphaerales bacterium]